MTDLMLLPSKDHTNIRLIRIPKDFERHEAFRHVTGLIAEVESVHPDYGWDDIAEALESQGYELMEVLLGPALD